MKKLLTLVAAAGLAATFTAAALAADQPPTEVPFPSPKVADVFVAAQTVATDGSLVNWFAPGSTVTFRAYAVDGKTSKILTAKDVKYFYVTIPNQPNVKLKYDPKAPGATSRLAWTGKWTIPAGYATGIVGFKVLVKTAAKKIGQFVQMPVATSMLTVSATPPAAPTGAAAPAAATEPAKLPIALYADSVNGSAPAGAPTRPVGCTQTNVYKRGERFVLRTWGVDTATGDIVSSANVDTATFTVAGQPAVNLAWGSHGATGAKVWFWTNFWIIPADYPLGAANVHVAFKLDSGKTGTFDYPITIIP